MVVFNNTMVLRYNLAKFVHVCQTIVMWIRCVCISRSLNISNIRVKMICLCPQCYCCNCELIFSVFVVEFEVSVSTSGGLGPKARNKK